MIIYHESSKTFHLYNNNISYIMTVLPNGHLGNLYFGFPVSAMTVTNTEKSLQKCLQHVSI